MWLRPGGQFVPRRMRNEDLLGNTSLSIRLELPTAEIMFHIEDAVKSVLLPHLHEPRWMPRIVSISPVELGIDCAVTTEFATQITSQRTRDLYGYSGSYRVRKAVQIMSEELIRSNLHNLSDSQIGLLRSAYWTIEYEDIMGEDGVAVRQAVEVVHPDDPFRMQRPSEELTDSEAEGDEEESQSSTELAEP